MKCFVCGGPIDTQFERVGPCCKPRRAGDRRMPRIVKSQHTNVIDTGTDYGHGERSPYWEWIQNHRQMPDGHSFSGHQESMEVPLANPDILSTDDPSPFVKESGLSVGDISKQLSGQQRKVFEMFVQEKKTESEIAAVLGIKKATVRTYLQRVRERFRFYV